MGSNPAFRAAPPQSRIHPALRSFADECRETVMRILAYVGALALIGLIIFTAANPLTDAAITAATTPGDRPGWSMATHSHPAFAVSQIDLPGAVASTEILRHPDGGRKDVLRWAAPGQAPAVEIELYRLGDEAHGVPDAAADLAARIGAERAESAQPAGLIDSKFGPVTLFDLAGPSTRCLGFFRRIDDAALRISGWTCQGDSLPQRRAAAACMLDRLVLLTAGGDAALADTFAHAELRRQGCTPAPGQAARADWVFGAQNPRLRGAF
ncbi:conserved hypothetical protein [Rhodopseudomonas palustris HaA2]|uniref:Uncharacterized protein n=1 Tax=Rhodopseudomonas palustris (strain HaA2) TaxID=316058 RepID=Q2J3B2_RHOP2|nr:hypothetical protein [Rhodopseudomonas palustris]ABD05048.1 conserved hypothetical protein [Rhodopseudomonas palustris HaA2]